MRNEFRNPGEGSFFKVFNFGLFPPRNSGLRRGQTEFLYFLLASLAFNGYAGRFHPLLGLRPVGEENRRKLRAFRNPPQLGRLEGGILCSSILTTDNRISHTLSRGEGWGEGLSFRWGDTKLTK